LETRFPYETKYVIRVTVREKFTKFQYQSLWWSSMSEDALEIELTAKQAALTTLLIGLVVGGLGGFSLSTAMTDKGNVQPAEEADSTSNQEAGEESTEFVSLEGIEFEGEPTKGSSDAPIKIVEYNEFGCPFCAEFQGVDASNRIPIDRMDIAGQLENQYIDEGQVQLISKDYPVPNLHPNGPEAHKAANCVYENEKDSYWDYYDQLFERRDAWMQSGDGNTRETFRNISEDLGLETEAIMQCYEESENQEANKDKNNALQNIGRFGTPTFFVGNRDTGFIKITGAQPLSRFEQAFDTIRNR
jgi:protein-disulfide isomerase